MSAQANGTPSPRWGSTTKLVVGLTITAIVAAMLVQFRTIIGPLILSFMLSYLLHPVIAWLSRITRFTWRASVNLIFLLVVILVSGLVTVAGLAIFQQLQSLIEFIQRFVNDVPNIVNNLTSQVYRIGPFQLDFSQFDLQSLTSQILGAVQSVIGRLGTVLSSFATSAAATLGWGLFVLLISYFLLAEAGQVSNAVVKVEIPGYNADIQRFGLELRRIWNSFLRGQSIIFLLIVVLYSILMTGLGVRYAIGIAIMAGVAKFVPYVGPAVAWSVTGAVSLLQGGNYFQLEPVQYALLVVGLAFILDQILDNLVTPRLLGDALGVHPAAVLVAAIVAANLIGLIGLVLAAPVVATLKLTLQYLVAKMLDQDPWANLTTTAKTIELPWVRGRRLLQVWWRTLRKRLERNRN